MEDDLVLKPSCGRCGSREQLYGSSCKHMTLCLSCGTTMARNRESCEECGTTVARLIRDALTEYIVRPSTSHDKHYFIGGFWSGLPNFSKKKNAEIKWSLKREGLQGYQVTDTFREKYKNRRWVLEDSSGQSRYHGNYAQTANYYVLVMQKKEFLGIPVSSWYDFKKEVQHKQLTLEEAEEITKNRRKTAEGSGRWMMRNASTGATAFGKGGRFDDKETGISGRQSHTNSGTLEDGGVSDMTEEDELDAAMKNRLDLNKRGGDDEEGPRGSNFDTDDGYKIEKGDDWEHEEIFTDDDEAAGNDPLEREDLDSEVPAPPDIKEDDSEEGSEEEGELSESGKELKKLLQRAGRMNESYAYGENEDDVQEDETSISPVLAAMKNPKKEPAETSPMKPIHTASAKGTSPLKLSKVMRKVNDDEANASNVAPPEKVKTAKGAEGLAKTENATLSESSTPAPSVETVASSTEPVTEEEIRAAILQSSPMTTRELVGKFKARVRGEEEKKAFKETLKRISKLQDGKGSNVVLKERKRKTMDD